MVSGAFGTNFGRAFGGFVEFVVLSADSDGVQRPAFGREFGEGFGFGSDQPALLSRERDLIAGTAADADVGDANQLRRLRELVVSPSADSDRAVEPLPIPVNGGIAQRILWRIDIKQSVEFDTDNEQSLDLQS
jgi:hypothetical protein